MIKYTFPFSSSYLTIQLEKKISDENFRLISRTLNYYLQDLNHNIVNSTADLFNKTNKDIPFKTTPIFTSFLQTNIEYSDKIRDIFCPFNNVEDNEKLSDLIKISTDESITKYKDIGLKTSILRLPFVLDSVTDLIEEIGITNYFLYFMDNYSAKKIIKEVDINIDEKLRVNIELQNEVTSLNFNPKYNKPHTPKVKFASTDTMIVPMCSLTKNINFVENKIFSLYINNNYMEGDLRMLSNKWGVDIIIIDTAGRRHDFSPIKKI